MNSLPGWHPLMVHFPVALVVAAALAFTAARLLREPRAAAALAIVGTWNLGAGAVMAMLAAGTGLAATVGLDVGEAARHAISVHVAWAAMSLLATALLAVWRGAGAAADARPNGTFLALVWLAAAVVLGTGIRGAINVYGYGIGVKPHAVLQSESGARGAGSAQ